MNHYCSSFFYAYITIFLGNHEIEAVSASFISLDGTEPKRGKRLFKDLMAKRHIFSFFCIFCG